MDAISKLLSRKGMDEPSKELCPVAENGSWEDDDEVDDESMLMFILMMSCSCIAIIPPNIMSNLGSDDSWLLNGVEERLFFNLFFNVEFQKFFISLSVRPGKRDAI